MRHRFSDIEWAALEARYPRCECGCGAFNEGINSSVVVGRILNMTGESKKLRAAEARAHQMAYELCYAWQGAVAKLHRIKSKRPRIVNGKPEELDDYEKKLLARNRRTDKPKKGRVEVGSYEVTSTYDDAMRVWTVDGRKRTNAARFSELSDTQQDVEGIPQSYRQQ